MSLVQVTSPAIDLSGQSKAVLLFGASWHEGCPPLEAVLKALAGTAPDVFFGNVDAEAVSALTDQHNVTSVPTLILMNGDKVTERLEGSVDPSQVTLAVQRLLSDAPSAAPPAAAVETDPQQALTERLDRLIRGDTVMLFMKGVPTGPRCGFSRQVVELLQEHKVPFGSFDILSDEEVRQGLKKHSNWPTYPQIYVKGELQGGLDIIKEMAEEGSLVEQWGLASKKSLDEKLGDLVKRSDVMVFMKGLPSAPKCGFSRQLVELLDETGVAYDAFNILQDEEVRQGLKTFSNWPTFPQLYVKGELVGGLDIVKELKEGGDLMDSLQV